MQQILITDEILQINFKDRSLSIEISAEDLKGKLNPTFPAVEDDVQEEKKATPKNNKKGK